MDERRQYPRQVLHRPARVGTVSEQRLPEASTVDISRGGLLLAFAEPVGFPVGQRIVVSIEFIDGTFHVMGVVKRVERGADFQVYVAMTFVELSEDDTSELTRHLGRSQGESSEKTASAADRLGEVSWSTFRADRERAQEPGRPSGPLGE